jgi:Aminotransferase class I and II
MKMHLVHRNRSLSRSARVTPHLSLRGRAVSQRPPRADFRLRARPHKQIVLGEILGALGLYLSNQGGPGGSKPGYLALVDGASHAGGVAVPVPLNKSHANDLPALTARVSSKTRAVYLINPHNPTGTISADASFKLPARSLAARAHHCR